VEIRPAELTQRAGGVEIVVLPDARSLRNLRHAWLVGVFCTYMFS